jgi:hypothetical protein
MCSSASHTGSDADSLDLSVSSRSHFPPRNSRQFSAGHCRSRAAPQAPLSAPPIQLHLPKQTASLLRYFSQRPPLLRGSVVQHPSATFTYFPPPTHVRVWSGCPWGAARATDVNSWYQCLRYTTRWSSRTFGKAWKPVCTAHIYRQCAKMSGVY